MRYPIQYLFASVLLTGLLTQPATAQVPEYVTTAPSADAYPADDGLILRQMVRVTLGADGKVETHVEESLKMMTAYLTRHDYFDPRVSWNDARSSLRLDQVRTYMADGTPIDAKDNSRVPNTADVFQWAVPYAHMRQMTLAHVGVEHGATSATAYTLQDRAPVDEPFYGVIELQSFLPILDQWITLEIPEGGTLNIAGVHCDVNVQSESKDGKTTYIIHRTDVPAVNLSETGWDHDVLQRLVYSNAPDWGTVRTHLARRIEAAAMADAAVTAKVTEVIDGSSQPQEKISRLHRFVVQGLRTIDWPVADFDHQVRTAGDVLDSSVGHPLDKAVLLVAMLRNAGLEANVALVSSDPAIPDAVACPDVFGQVWVQARLGNKEVWLDPTASRDARNKWDLAGLPVLLLDPAAEGVSRRPGLDAEDNRAALLAEVTLKAGEDSLAVSGWADLDLAKGYNPLVDFDREGTRHERVAGKVAGAFGGADVDGVTVARQGCGMAAFRAEFSGGSIPVPEHGLVSLRLPRVPGALSGGALETYRTTRTLPLRLPDGPVSERVDVTLTLPDGFEVAHLPADLSLANAAGSVRRTLGVDDGVLTASTLLIVEQGEIAPADYPAFRELLDAVEADSQSLILLRRR